MKKTLAKNKKVAERVVNRISSASAQNTLKRDLRKGLESLRNNRGVFTAANSDDYSACWVRDQLYATLCYYYTGETKKFTEGVHVVFDILHNPLRLD